MTETRKHPSTAVAFGLLGLVAALPWYFGGATGMGHFVLAVVMVPLVLLHIAGTASNTEESTPLATGMVTVLIAGILLGIAQLVSWPAPIASVMAPTAERWRNQMGVGAEEDGSKPVRTRSLYPPATRKCLALLVVITAGCLLAMGHLHDGRAVRWLLMVGLVTGGVIAVVGIAHVLRSNGKWLWMVPFTQGGVPFGPFVNRNNAAGFLNLCLACGVGLVAWVHRVQFAENSQEVRRRKGFGLPTGLAASRRWLAELDGDRVMVWAGVLLIGAGVMSSLSRGSCMALAAAAVVTVGAVRRWSGSRVPWWASLLLALGTIAMVIWLGRMELLSQRFGQASTDDGRWSNWLEALRAWPGFWSWGSGLETWQYLYLPFEKLHANTGVHLHAENQFIQALTDAGVVGLALLLSAIGVMAWSITRLVQAGDRTSSALAVAATFALVSQVVGGMFDFGLFLPANALMMCLICGATCGRAAALRRAGKGNRSPVVGRSRWIFGMLAAGAVFAAWEFYQFARVQRLTTPVAMQAADEIRDDRKLALQVATLSAATRYRADDAMAQYAVARLWMQRFRVQAAGRMQRVQPWVDPEVLWQRSSPISLLAVNKQLGADGTRTGVLRDLEAGLPLLEACRVHAQRAVQSCPWDSRYQLQLATVMQLLGESEQTASVLERARRFAGGNPELWFRIGGLDHLAGRESVARESWDRCLELGPGYQRRMDQWK